MAGGDSTFKNTTSITFPMKSSSPPDFDDFGNPIWDRAIGSKDLASIDNQRYRNGIFITDGSFYEVVPHNGMQLRVKRGYACIEGHFTFIQEDYIIQLDDSGTLDRTDRIVLQLNLDDLVRDVLIIAKTGTTTLTRTSTIYELGICDVLVKKNVKVIETRDINNTIRLNNDICGFCANEFLDFDTTALYTKINAQTDKQQADWIIQMNNQKNDYANWKAQIDNWKAQIILEFQERIGFDFDNYKSIPAVTWTFTQVNATKIKEEAKFTYDNSLLASLETEFKIDGSIIEILKVYNVDDSLFISTQSTTTFVGGIPKTVVISY